MGVFVDLNPSDNSKVSLIRVSFIKSSWLVFSKKNLLDIGDKWPQPDVMDSYVFLVSEIGEVGDALLRGNYGHRADYSRNNTKYVDVAAELGDVFLMRCTLATCLGVDLDTALQDCIDHFREKYGNIKSSS